MILPVVVRKYQTFLWAPTLWSVVSFCSGVAFALVAADVGLIWAGVVLIVFLAENVLEGADVPEINLSFRGYSKGPYDGDEFFNRFLDCLTAIAGYAVVQALL